MNQVRLIINSDGEKTRVFIAETGIEIENVTQVAIDCSHGKVTAKVELCSQPFSCDAVGKFSMKSPATGEVLEIKRIEFENGEVFES